MRIDVHAHYWAQPYIDALVAAGRPDLGHAGQVDDLDARLAVLDANEVDVQIFSAIGLNVDIADAQRAAAATRLINDLYVDVRARYGGRFTGFASVPLPHVQEAIAESRRALDELGLPGIGLPCIVDGKPIDHADYEEFWAALGARPDGAIVYVHPSGMDSLAHPGLGDFHLNMAIGSPMQIAMAPLRLALGGISTRYPRLRFVFALCGGILPYLWPRYEHNLRRGIAQSSIPGFGAFYDWMKQVPLDPEDPMSLLRPFYFDTSVQDIPAALRLSKETFGAGNVLLGSDEVFASLAESIENIRGSADLTETEKRAILDENAHRLLGHLLEVPAGRAAAASGPRLAPVAGSA